MNFRLTLIRCFRTIISLCLIATIELSTVAQVPIPSATPATTPLPKPTPSPSPILKNEKNRSVLETAAVVTNTSSTAENSMEQGVTPISPSLLIGTPMSDLFTGTMSMTEPLSVPQARGSVTPEAALQYRSGSGNGWLGVGWELEPGHIERNTKFGLNYDGNDFVLKMGGANIELVSIRNDEYRAKIEESFLRIRKLKDADQRPYWEVTNKNGIRFLFGQTVRSRQNDPAEQNHIFKWYLDRVLDPHGNYSDYVYTKDQNEVYLDLISYAGNGDILPNHLIKFFLEKRVDIEDSYATTFHVQTRNRLRTIAVFSNDILDTAYKLEYSQSANTGRSLLSKLTQVGRDAAIDDSGNITGGTFLPAKIFNYSSTKLFFHPETSIQPSLEPATSLGWGELNRYRFNDFNGDGRSDILHIGTATIKVEEVEVEVLGTFGGAPFPFKFKTQKYTTTPHKDKELEVRVSDGKKFISGGPLTKTKDGSSSRTNWINQIGNGEPARYFVADVNGDGKSDIIFLNINGSQQIFLSNGENFAEGGTYKVSENGDPSRYRFADVNSDGKADCVYIASDGTITFGKSTSEPISTWVGTFGNGDPARYHFGDFNGDGKMDIVYIDGEGVQSVSFFNSNSSSVPWKRIKIGNGDPARYQYADFNGDEKTDLVFIGANGNENVSLSSGSSFIDSWTTTLGNGNPQKYFFQDFNGDGKADIIYFPHDPLTEFQLGYELKILLSSGTSFKSELVQNVDEHGATPFYADFNGDGKPDQIWVDPNTLPSPHLTPGKVVAQPVTWGTFKNNRFSFPDFTAGPSIPVDYCTFVDNGIGGTSEILYKIKNLSFPFPVIDSITTKDGRGETETVNYEFDNGYYYVPERDFRGFNHVKEIGPVGDGGEQKITEMWFHQGNDVAVDVNNRTGCVGFMKGKPYRTRVTDGKGTVFSESTIAYQKTINVTCEDSFGQSYFNPPIETNTYICETGACLDGKHTREKYAYDRFGNLIRQELFGDVDSTGDELTILTTYAPNETAWIVGLPSGKSVHQGIGTASLKKKSAVSLYYDGSNDCNIPSTNQVPIKGDLTRIVSWLDGGTSPEQKISYDIYGNPVCVQDPLGGMTKITYDFSATFPTVTENSMGLRSTREYYGVDNMPQDGGGFGQLALETDPNNAVVSFEYDAFGRNRKVILPDNSLTEWFYENFGNPNNQFVRTVTNSGLSNWTYFDGFGRTWLEKMSGPSGEIISTVTNYDARGLVAKTSLPYFDGKEQPKFSSFTYDPLGRVVSAKNPDGTRRNYCYQNRVTAVMDENGHRTRFVEDAFGRTSDVQEYEGIYEQCQTDLNVPLSSQERKSYASLFPEFSPPSTHGPYAAINLKYDVLGNVIESIDAKRNKTTIDYDTLGRRVALNDVDLGGWHYSYDANGNVIKRVDAKDQAIYYRFDVLNRIIQKDYAAQKKQGDGDVVYTYDGNGDFRKGRLTEVRDNTGATSFAYDAMGRITKEDRTLGGTSYSTKASYDELGRIVGLTYPDGKGVKYKYDGPFLSTVKDDSDGTTFVRYEGYNSLGKPTKINYGNGVTTRLNYANSQNSECPADNFRLCSSTTTTSTGAILQRLKYLYDGVGNITGIIDNERIQSTYVYDAQNQLVAAGHSTFVGTPNSPVALPSTSGMTRTSVETAIRKINTSEIWDSFFTYDEIGNMTYNSQRGTYNYSGPKPHAVKSVSGDQGITQYNYDANGNLERTGGSVFQYDYENRLTSVTNQGNKTAFSYDWSDQRVQLSMSASTTNYISEFYSCVQQGACTKQLFAADERIAQMDDAAGFYYHSDLVGSTRLVSNMIGEGSEKFSYSAFGEIALNTQPNPPKVSYLFTGSKFDSSTGLYYLQARYYDPALGRFITPDTMVPYAPNPQSFNRYTYAANNPITYSDTNGHYWRDNSDGGSREKPGGGHERERESNRGREIVRSGDPEFQNVIAGDGPIFPSDRNKQPKPKDKSQSPPRERPPKPDKPKDSSQEAPVESKGPNKERESREGRENSVWLKENPSAPFQANNGHASTSIIGPVEILIVAGIAVVALATVVRASSPLVTTFKYTTRGNSITNMEVDLTKTEFIQNLGDSGFLKTLSRDGTVTNMTKGDLKYSIYNRSTSGKVPSAEKFIRGESIIKIRLRP